jgi:hypothetical protein
MSNSLLTLPLRIYRQSRGELSSLQGDFDENVSLSASISVGATSLTRICNAPISVGVLELVVLEAVMARYKALNVLIPGFTPARSSS